MLLLLALLSVSSSQCELPTMSIGDFNVTSERQLKDIIKKEPVFLIGLTSKSCEFCCRDEPFYASLLKTLSQYSPRMPLIRHNVDSSTFIRKYISDKDRMPSLYGVKNGKFFKYQDLHEPIKVLKFADKLITPVTYLNKLEDVLKYYKPPTGGLNSLKVLALLTDTGLKTEYENTVSGLSSWFSAEFKATTNFKVIADLILIKPDIPSVNCLLLWTLEEFKVLDLEIPEDMQKWIIKNSVGLLDEINALNFPIYMSGSLPMLFIFIDPENEYKAEFLTEIKKSAKKYEDRVAFMWINATSPEFSQKKKHLGLVTEILPAVAFNTKNDTTYAFPEGAEITEKSIDGFVKEFLDGEKSRYVSQYKPRSISLQNCEKATSANFEAKTLKSGADTLIFLYSSHNSKDSEKVSPLFNNICLKVKELGISNLQALSFDAATEKVHKSLKSNRFPALFFSSVDKREKKPVVFSGNFDERSLVAFVKKNSGVYLELNEGVEIRDQGAERVKDGTKDMKKIERDKDL